MVVGAPSRVGGACASAGRPREFRGRHAAFAFGAWSGGWGTTGEVVQRHDMPRGDPQPHATPGPLRVQPGGAVRAREVQVRRSARRSCGRRAAFS
ncbi:hypothetical protein ACFPM0_26000 [Pseudonocardia sulfidoxydans]|uniref:hypothetical protein n=1 Tax=Pseudonocardia sulfidoxydans TaxID=54011 RepID=UPI00362195E2